MLIIQLAIKMFVQATNWKLAIVIALVVAATYSATSIDSTSMNGVFNSKDLVNVSTGLIKEAGVAVNVELQEISQDITEFQKESKKALQTLEDTAEDLLNTNTRLAPLVIFGETPDQFFDRTTHYGNIGAYTLDVVSNYVDTALRLPQISDTIKGV